MLDVSEIDQDINLKRGLSANVLKEARYGVCKYIADICSSINV